WRLPRYVVASWCDTPSRVSSAPASSRNGHALIIVAALVKPKVPERNATGPPDLTSLAGRSDERGRYSYLASRCTDPSTRPLTAPGGRCPHVRPGPAPRLCPDRLDGEADRPVGGVPSTTCRPRPARKRLLRAEQERLTALLLPSPMVL